ncbi:DNA translocase FtsK [Rhodosalinus halophilus]|uniref:DNA translocase FtsK n=1 Tax=Rhodosalinus halophilus TaxID=2259333 RepID=A0A365UAL2_9RHOB|nr:DNA translocase FtsK [Rhodosalinus halophilus]RBI86250.1 DNA translocase FtsK [Rhodosalinus halophilus]
MAYQARGRDPLLDSEMADALEKRGKELVGLALIALGAAVAALLASYHPDDPSWMAATDGPVHNWLGRTGATVAAPLILVVGLGAWGIAAVTSAWGLRLFLHRGEERALGRVVFAPIWIAALSVYAATLVPGDGWTHPFGLGGFFGDTVVAAMLTAAPLGPGLGLKLVSAGMALALVAMGAFVLGFSRAELRGIGRFVGLGVVVVYASLITLLKKAARLVANAARLLAHGMQAGREGLAARAEARAAARAEAAEEARAATLVRRGDAPDTRAPAQRSGGLLARMPALVGRPEPMPEPELIDRGEPQFEPEMPGEGRIRARIADAVRARAIKGGVANPPKEAPLTRGRGRGPDPLVLDTSRPRREPPLTAAGGLATAAEPPLTAAHAARPEDDDQGFEETEWDAATAWRAAEAEHDPAPASQPSPRPRLPVAEPPRPKVEAPPRKAPPPSRRAREEAQPALRFAEPEESAYELPPLALLRNPDSIERHYLSEEALAQNARMLESVLEDYGVKGDIVSVRPGPVVTMYELEPAPGLKASRVIGLADDIARSMSALSARVSTVPGRSVIGIELPNDKREMVLLREILASRDFGDGTQKLPLALGKTIGGESVVANLAKMPHLLIAGTTGSGKSVAINTFILSLLYKLTPDECRLIMIDPKMLELSVYDGIPHLLSPVVTDPKKAVVALKWVVGEMEERYRKMSKMGVRNIDGYNSRVEDAQARGEMFRRTVQTGFDDETGEPVFETEEFAPEKMPYIVVIVDEMADLMMVAGKEIEACIQRLAQMARASGIHLIMATQRPSVDVITGTIKANFPTRISFQVTSKIDSRTILGEQGAEQLLGQGDMLYMAGGGRISRCHGPFVSDEEVEEIVNHLKAFGEPDYVSGVVEGPDEDRSGDIDAVLGLGGNTDGEDALYDQAVQIVARDRKCSTSYIQRKLGIGYNKAARLVEQMEDQGVVSPANHVGKREILLPEPQ